MATVLVIEDQKVLRTMLEDVLGNEGYGVICAASGDEAIRTMGAQTIEVVIMDVVLSGTSCLYLLSHMMRNHPDTPVVVLAGADTISSAIAALKLGAFDYVRKPINMEELIHAVKLAIKMNELAQELQKAGVRTYIDDRTQYTPGWKYHEWEMKGVPVRVEIGPKDLQHNQVTVVRRDTGKKALVDRGTALQDIIDILSQIQEFLFERANKKMMELTTTAQNMESFKRVLEEKGGFIKGFLCDEACEETIQKETGATVRLIAPEESQKGECIHCRSDNSRLVYFARAY